MSIVVSHLVKNYGTQIAVNDLSFSLEKGEIVGFLGPNGAGKSTTMKMITGSIEPDAGFIEVNGINMSKDPIAGKKGIGYLAESNPHYYDLYVKEYLQFVAEVHEIKEVQKQITKVIEQVGLGPEQHKKIGQLSKGYKQRVGLAAAIIHEPDVLILDEPTTGLDPNQIIEIRQLIKELGQNKTVLFSSHILQEVEAICGRVIIIHKGNLVANQPIHELNQNNSLEEVFRSLTGAISV
ncbi:MAG: ATP-binding cassette domain-containing protein [Sediminibacterium sp.]|jgi:ABC-2 type transport system ATP-binding protein|uniref:ATP-binding cassette domain-containing protein n=1 Tax=Sediminibacterium sp. TaxID=1917865 RepID=UPI000BC7F736|nr:ATP-binding cassette domain-containing protein [Sediminibacterium sp.]OYY09901.1 MAG: multidrug ABC transporter ATP-binding protein [Sphingobacteriia bacterium 35-36-14]OYZ54083.1 MAG: multidrug ABC transporter ATP-binding protein [Sphingobacteriia bacterium 24-36-13]OZA62583.1 MAG: multidrug ABC transporter ATP-binding protein [Sphingobacteriia bacterium 39-36-14]MBP7346421.1 ATP-binding cassette domain-containing protein [Sediminibacterium sp.]MDO8997370.1 ATP-binding cassette domain-cont